MLSRRWAIFAVVVILAAWGAWALGQWQFHRLQETRANNLVIRTNLARLPAPIDEVMAPGKSPTNAIQWRRVTVTGVYDNANSVALKYQTNDAGHAGIDVVTPLRTANGISVLVDRGWKATENSGNVEFKLPPAVPGTVTVTGYVRENATGGAAEVSGLATRAISSVNIGKVLGYPLYGGFLDLAVQSPPTADNLTPADLPDDTSDGPHFFYGLQWWFFGVLAVFGFFYLMYDERKQLQAARDQGPDPDAEPSQAPEHAPVDREHHARHE